MQSAAATASVKVRNSLDFFMGAVLLFKVRVSAMYWPKRCLSNNLKIQEMVKCSK